MDDLAEAWLQGTWSIWETRSGTQRTTVLRTALQKLLDERNHKWTWDSVLHRLDVVEAEVSHKDTRKAQYTARAPTVSGLIVILLECELPQDDVWCRDQLAQLRRGWAEYSPRGASRWDF